MERGNSKHSARVDEALDQATASELGPGGSNREEWAAAEPPADDDPPLRVDPRERGPVDTGVEGGTTEGADNQDEAEMRRLKHDMSVANDWNPGADD
jgi:hypothetical protein